MTLDEAIKHCKEKAEEKRKDYEQACAYNIPSEGCLKCAEEHEQLAEWLEELKDWRKLKPVCAFDGYVVYKERTEFNDISKIEGYCDTCKHNNEGNATSEACQWCDEFSNYERDEAK